MKKLAVILACALFAAPAFGQSTSFPKEVRGYNDIFVTITDQAAKCNIKDPGVFKARLREKLGEIGIKEDPSTRVFPTLAIAGDTFGVMGTLCNFNVRFAWQASLMASEIKANDTNIRAALDRMKALPIVLYQESSFGVVTLTEPNNPDAAQPQSMVAQDKALEFVDKMVATFAKRRGQ